MFLWAYCVLGAEALFSPGHLGGVEGARARREWALMPHGIAAGSRLRLGLRGRCSARYLDEGIFSVFHWAMKRQPVLQLLVGI